MFFACCFMRHPEFPVAPAGAVWNLSSPYPEWEKKSPRQNRVHFNVGLLTGTKIRGKYRIAGLQKVLQNEKKGSEAF
jgi:hypothetical protein